MPCPDLVPLPAAELQDITRSLFEPEPQVQIRSVLVQCVLRVFTFSWQEMGAKGSGSLC